MRTRHIIEGENEQNFNDRLDVLKHLSEVKVRIRNDITSDFILACLNEKEKEFIIEMTGNAYYAKRLVTYIGLKSKKREWDDKKGVWIVRRLDKEERRVVEEIGNTIFDSYMMRIYMMVLMNRNIEKNYLVKVLAGVTEKEDEEQKVAELKNKETKGLISGILSPNKEK